MSPFKRSTSYLIIACFFLSGMAGLIYEVVWARQLSLFLGITSYAHTAVITAYMAGLAAGSFYFGDRADQSLHPLRTYAWLEIGVGVYAALTPWLIPLLQNGYLGLSGAEQIGTTGGHLIRFAIALLALLVPTFLMGGTLPLLVRGFVTRLEGLGKVTSRLYGINTLGAMTGTLLAGYVLLPGLGISRTIFFAVFINLGIAALILGLFWQPPKSTADHGAAAGLLKREKAHAVAALSTRQRTVLMAGFGIAGFAALLTQMAWIRALILVVGGSVYAFTITLASFLAGIGIGSLLFRRFLAIKSNKSGTAWMHCSMVQAALLALTISLTLLLGLPLISKMPEWFLSAYTADIQQAFWLFQLFIFALSFILMVLPTLCMGALFPLITASWTNHFSRAGHGVGVAYGVNTVGTILGALLGGLVILPWLGMHNGIRLAAALYFLVAAAFWLLSVRIPRPSIRLATIFTALLVFASLNWAVPPWNRELMVAGVFQSPRIVLNALGDNSLPELVSRFELLYYNEGRDGTVAVRKNGDQRSLVINGKTDASSHNDLSTQVMLAQLPLALNREVKSALVIGLGSGITAGSLATSQDLEKLRILEISGEVVEASILFKAENYAVLDDPRTELVTADARNFLAASPDRYDLIVSEPSNPWLTGISNLFTDEFLAQARNRLNPGGIMTQWFHTYGMSNDDLRVLLRTFKNNFKHVSVWTPQLDDIILIGSDEPHAIGPTLDMARARELSRASLKNDRDLVRLYLIGGEQLSRYVRGSRINSDDRPLIEFNAPRYLYADTSFDNTDDMISFLEQQEMEVPVQGMVQLSSGSMDALFMNLQVTIDEMAPPMSIRPKWTVSHRSISRIEKKVTRVIGSERMLYWDETPSRFQIRANWRERPLPNGELNRMVERMSSVAGREARLLKLSGDVEAAGIVSTDVGGSGLLLTISWQCRAWPSGFTHFVLRGNLPDPGRSDWSDTMERQASRLRCK